MKKIGTLAAAALFAAGMTATGASAAPLASGAAQGVAKADTSQTQLVRWHGGGRGWGGHGHWRGHGGHWGGWGAAAAAGLLLTAPYWAGYGYGPYDDDYYDGGYAYDEGGVDRCEATFRSFDPATGTYMGYDGVRHRCPYL